MFFQALNSPQKLSNGGAMTSFPVLMSNILWLVIVYIFTLLLLEHSGNTELKARKALSEKKAHCQTYGLEVHQNTYHLNSPKAQAQALTNYLLER